MKEFTIKFIITEDSTEYVLQFKDSEREHIFDRFIDIGYFLKALGYVNEF